MIAHLPTWLALIGYPLYFLALIFNLAPHGRVAPAAWLLWLAVAIASAAQASRSLRSLFEQIRQEFNSVPLFQRLFILSTLAFTAAILLIAAYAARLPPHLGQESDVLNYHYTIVRQHLIAGSFAHIRWSAADLLPLPLQSALAPYWFSMALPNKLPQFLFLLGLCASLFRIIWRLAPTGQRLLAGAIVMAALVGSHGFSIQFGTAMLDIPLCYFGVAALDSVLHRRPYLAGLELAFLVWAKFPLLYLAVIVFAVLLAMAAHRLGWQCQLTGMAVVETPRITLRQALVSFLLGSVVIGGPFCVKTTLYAGTPVFPFHVGAVKSSYLPTGAGFDALARTAHRWLETVQRGQDDVGVKAFLKHFWILAVPTRGVNNNFDYPMGLPYLLFLLPVAVIGLLELKRREFPLLWVIVVLLWAAWWKTSHQARFLYFPIAVVFVLGALRLELRQSRVIQLGLLAALLMTLSSTWRANRQDLKKSGWESLQPMDRQLVLTSQNPAFQDRHVYEWPAKEAAFATFQVNVSKGDLFVIPPS